MYDAFDDFLRISTWYTRHANDEERFFRALERVVRNPGFRVDSFGEYIDRKRQSGEDAQAGLTNEAYEQARDYYVNAAKAVYKYLRITGQGN